jgi:phage baseplate assembly protein W
LLDRQYGFQGAGPSPSLQSACQSRKPSSSLASHDLYLKTDEEAVKTALKHLIQTRNFERPFHPEIGTQVHSLLFENFSPAVKLAMERTIQQSITKFETRVRLIEVNVSETVEENDLLVNIVFALKNTDNPITITTLLSRVR